MQVNHGIYPLVAHDGLLNTASDGFSPAETANAPESANFWGKDGFTFGDLLDIVNPLQHIPVVSTVYRAMTGDEISTGSRLAGAGLFGGPFGFLSAALMQTMQETGGGDIGARAFALLSGEDVANEAEAVVAEAASETTAPIETQDGGSAAATPPAENENVLLHQAALTAAPPATPAGGRPRMSVGAFDTLVARLGAMPTATMPEPRAAAMLPELRPTNFGTAAPPSSRAAALELHDLLARYRQKQDTSAPAQ